MKIALVVGHRQSSQGAVSDTGISEFNFNSELAKKIKQYVHNQDIEIFYRRDDLSGYTERMKDLHKRIDAWGAEVSVSMHFNAAANPKAQGHEVLYCSSIGKDVAKQLNNKFNEHLNNKDRGIKKKTKKDRGGGFLCRGKSVCILAEPFFAAHQSKYAKGEDILHAYVEFVEELC